MAIHEADRGRFGEKVAETRQLQFYLLRAIFV